MNLKKIDENIAQQSDKIANQLIEIMTKEECSDPSKISHWMENNYSASHSLDNLSDEEWLAERVCKANHIDVASRTKQFRNIIDKDCKKRNRRVLFYTVAVASAIMILTFLVYNNDIYTKKEVVTPLPIAQNINQEIIETPTLITEKGSISVKSSDADNNKENIINIENLTNKGKLTASTKEKIYFSRFVVPERTFSKIELSDGTIVHLNAGSELIFPEKFTEESRLVELKGEGYFEVVNNGTPFSVNTGGIEVRVYGTKFNINAYDNTNIETVLVEGSVGIIVENKEIMLKSGELCVVNKGDKSIEKRTINTDKYIAWTTGYFMFENEIAINVINHINRWFNEDYKLCDDACKDKIVSIIISRDATPKEIVNLFSLVDIEVKVNNKLR